MSDKTDKATEPTLKVGDKTYKLADLSKQAKSQLAALRFADTEVQRLNLQLSLAKTARNAYQQALMAELAAPAPKA